MIPPTRISTLANFLAFVIVVNLSSSVKTQREEDQRVFVDIQALPDPFTNDKLPGLGNAIAKEKCYNMMGCFEELPITTIPQNPLSIRTEFQLYYKDLESTRVEFGKYENCLRDKPDECDRYPFNLQAILDSPFVPTRRTVVIIGGYFSKAPSSWEVRLKDLWTQLDDVNVIVLCWVGGNSGLYPTAAANTRPVARQLTVLLYYLAKLKGGPELGDLELSDDVFTEKFYMIGHSLGAHIAAFVGQDLNGRLGRITGLDPAGPSFDVLDRRFRIDRSDAQLVDILHTNAGSKIFSTQSQYGSALASGHIDLWANDGSHQPGCTNDMLGCSHKRANKFYEAFLNHQLSMQNLLKSGSGAHRLYAYSSDTFNEFHNGTSFMKRCPITTLDDDDQRMPDIDRCSIPVDYLGWFDTVRQELETGHGIDFSLITNSSSTPVPNNYYFFTKADTEDQMDHYLVRIRVSKLAFKEDRKMLERINSLYNRGGCDVGFEIEMSNGLETSYKIKKYRLLDRLDHLEIVFPYLSPGIVSKYELAKLDTADYFVTKTKTDGGKSVIEETDLGHVRESVSKIFPAWISVRGFNNGEQSSDSGGRKQNQKRGFFNSIARFFHMANSNDQDDQDDDDSASSAHADCQLTIESFTIQPLRKFHRHLSAVFTRDCAKNQTAPNIILLDDDQYERQSSPTVDLLNQAAIACDKVVPGSESFAPQPKLALNTIIIGPPEPAPPSPSEPPSLLASGGGKGDNEGLNEEKLSTEESRLEGMMFDGRDESAEPPTEQHETQDTSTTHEDVRSRAYLWLIMTLLLFLCMLVLIIISMLTLQRAPPVDKQGIAMTNPNHRSSFPPDINLIS